MNYLDGKVHGANMGPIWGQQDSGGPNVGPMSFAIWELLCDIIDAGNGLIPHSSLLPEPVLTFCHWTLMNKMKWNYNQNTKYKNKIKKINLKMLSANFQPMCWEMFLMGFHSSWSRMAFQLTIIDFQLDPHHYCLSSGQRGSPWSIPCLTLLLSAWWYWFLINLYRVGPFCQFSPN